MKPSEILAQVSQVIDSRGTERDLPTGERSMPLCVKTFNALTGNEISIEDGWIFMLILKLSRMREGKFKIDDYYDAIGYMTLATEEAVSNAVRED